MPVAMLIDTTLCTACRGCQVACKNWWDLPAEETRNRGSYENPADLSPSTWTRVTFHEVDTAEGVEWYHLATGCMHCTEAACVAVCPTGALERDARLGNVTVRRERCNGCGYCVDACPFGIPRLETHNVLSGRAAITKCNMCQDRLANDLIPACAKTCPTGAISFGERTAMVAKGKQKVAQLAKQGRREASLYGETELGGLGRMFVLGVSPDKVGLPVDPKFPATVTTWKKVVRPFGKLAIAGTVAGLALNWFVNFRSRRREAAPAPAAGEEK